jgi:hypothetical protein
MNPQAIALALRIAELQERIQVAEIQNAKRIALEIMNDELWDLKRQYNKLAR